MQGLLGGLPPGLAGFVAQRQMAGQEQNQQLQQAQGLLSMQQAQQQQGLLAQQMADKQKQQAQIEAYAQTLPPEQQQAFRVDPSGFMRRANEIKVAAPGSTILDGRGSVLQTIPAAPKVQPKPQIVQLMEQAGIDPNSPQGREMINRALVKSTTHAPAPSATVVNRQESEEAKVVGRELGQQYADLQKAAMAAPGRIAKLNRMAQLSDGVMTGALTPLMTDVASVAESVGIKIDPNLGPKQAYEALSNEIALSNRSTGEGAGMPGAMSDKDRDFLKAMGPGLNKTPEGNRMVIETGIKIERRKQEVARLAQDYRAKKGTLEGFSQELQKWADANPLFPNAPKPAESAPSAPKVRKYNPATGNIE